MSNIQSYVDMPKDYFTKAEDYKAGDAEKVNNRQAGEVQKDVNANVAILDKNIEIAKSNIASIQADYDKVLAQRNEIDLELNKVNQLISNNMTSSGFCSFSKLPEEDIALLKKFGITGSIGVPAQLTAIASSSAAKLKDKISPPLDSFAPLIEAEQAKLKGFNDQKNVQLNRLAQVSPIAQDAETYGIGMALALFQLQCAKSSNDEAYVKLQEVKLAQGKSGDITTALEAARNLKNLIDAGKNAGDKEYDEAKTKLETAITKVNTPVDASTIKLNDGSVLTDDLKAKLGKFDSISVKMPSIDLSNDDKRSTSSKNVDEVINSLSSWQTTYTNKVNTIMVELNDASSKYSTFTSGANQSLQKATDILTKLVGNFA